MRGLRSNLVRQRLFAESDLNYKKALQLVNTLEAAEWNSVVEGSRVTLPDQELSEKTCGDNSHGPQDCRYRGQLVECSYYGRVGHSRTVFWKRQFNHRKSEKIKL